MHRSGDPGVADVRKVSARFAVRHGMQQVSDAGRSDSGLDARKVLGPYSRQIIRLVDSGFALMLIYQ
jgi:hypothetical protein